MRNIPFSPPDMSEVEASMVAEVLGSGWITTGPKTKEFEHLIAMCCGTQRAVCLNSATACMEMALRVLGIGLCQGGGCDNREDQGGNAGGPGRSGLRLRQDI